MYHEPHDTWATLAVACSTLVMCYVYGAYTVFHTIRVERSLFRILSHISSMLCAIGMRYISK